MKDSLLISFLVLVSIATLLQFSGKKQPTIDLSEQLRVNVNITTEIGEFSIRIKQKTKLNYFTMYYPNTFKDLSVEQLTKYKCKIF